MGSEKDGIVGSDASELKKYNSFVDLPIYSVLLKENPSKRQLEIVKNLIPLN